MSPKPPCCFCTGGYSTALGLSCWTGAAELLAGTAASSSVSMTMMGCPTLQIESFVKLISFTTPEAVEGIFATNLSVNTSHRSSYYSGVSRYEPIYLLNPLPDFNKHFLDGGFFGPFAQIRQLNLDHLPKPPGLQALRQ